ncbi:unnamed protein product [Bursaphelenchus okinawaensis]|uniref:Amino acid transporter transmembrane domain-containing protein n=1 Tax=Bursaphelenchus okinawaensis TaxID=465554 RepID=A0A811KXW4_9BILA|nr:unnamed protein product [Bursaphelenchus okinawaensis]CAG9113482.1 unnamed protein product [Bursaphelenchus okinawaensis]
MTSEEQSPLNMSSETGTSNVTSAERETAATKQKDSGSEASLTQSTEKHGITGLSWFVTALFMLGALVGGGLVTLPLATVRTNIYVSIFFIVLMGLMSIYSAHVLGLCWIMLMDRWPKYRQHCRKPYPEIATRAGGKFWKFAVSVCVDVTQFGTAVVYLLLSAKNIRDIILIYTSTEISYCYVVLIVAACFLPCTMLRSPQDFWGAVIMGMATSAISAVLITASGFLDYSTCGPVRELPPTMVTNYFLAVGTYMFSFCGHAAFPTIQHDMKKPTDFTKSAATAFTTMICLYIPVSLVGYLTYGDSMKSSIIGSIQITWIQQIVNIAITCHCILSLTITMNPLNQEIEDFFKVPHRFNLKRVLVRTMTMVAVVFVAESIPNFGPLLDLIGGSSMALSGLVFPCLFYLRLKASSAENNDGKAVDPHSLSIKDTLAKNNIQTNIISMFIIISAFFFSLATSGSAIYSLSSAQFVVPCYLQPFFGADRVDGVVGAVDCCGHWQNVTRSDDIKCSRVDMGMYEIN